MEATAHKDSGTDDGEMMMIIGKYIHFVLQEVKKWAIMVQDWYK
jgi:hypothetical protein